MTRTPPSVGPPDIVRFPPVTREVLGNGLSVWVIEEHSVPTVTATLVVDRGCSADPPERPGLAGLTADLLDDGAGGRSAIELADALGDLGCELSIEVGPDITTLGFSSLARNLEASLGLLADVVRRPNLHDADFRRVVELRRSRLQQRRRSAGASADRTLLAAIFGAHPYGHGALGTTASLDAMTLDEPRAFWAEALSPQASTLIVAGDVDAAGAVRGARAAFDGWRTPAYRSLRVPPASDGGDRSVLFVERPGAPQSEMRVGHVGPPRSIGDYHGLLVLDSILGGQFSSRINRNLREVRGLTYGARTSFGFRRAAGSFVCDTSVQSDRTAEAAAEILREWTVIREDGSTTAEELARGKAALSRGYVRNFETAAQFARAATELVAYGLDDGTFDRFVPSIEAVGRGDIDRLAREHVRPDEATVVVVGDPVHLPSLEGLGRPVSVVTPEF